MLSKKAIIEKMVCGGYKLQTAKNKVEKNYDFLKRVYGDQDITAKKAVEILGSIS